MIVIVLIILLFLIVLLHYFYKKPLLIENLDDTDTNTNTNTDTDTDKNYQDYDNLKNDPSHGSMMLAIKNAANIAALRSQLNTLSNLKNQVTDISGLVQTHSKALVNIGNEVGNIGYSAVGGKPPKGKPLPTLSGLN